ncbi:hypothetical protein CBR_g31752 [Chara braunii]|uniref:Uncharacterized protein n=1 Tax=Chara braunii TaxID=69332 RepID=A0A388JY93_CHABU|nr:hypothetical protein CBR_g31752 [Chara braunii]|eukprot:GBG62735.1 hypothetical protein CBR_g31752 [Chara braunii]
MEGGTATEEVFAWSIAITYKLQLEEMHATLCQARVDLLYEVLLEGEDIYDGLDDELYELISSRQQDAGDKEPAIAVFYDCVEMVQRIKNKFSDLLARRHTRDLSSTAIQIATIPPASFTTSPTTLTSPIVAFTTTTSSSAAATSLITASSVQQGGLLEQAGEVRGQEPQDEGLPSCAECADQICFDVNALTNCGGRGLEGGRGLCAGIDECVYKDDAQNAVVGLSDCVLAADDMGDGRCGENNNNNKADYIACNGRGGENNNSNKADYIACSNKICDNTDQGEDTDREVSAIRLLLSSQFSSPVLLSFLCAVRHDWGQG